MQWTQNKRMPIYSACKLQRKNPYISGQHAHSHQWWPDQRHLVQVSYSHHMDYEWVSLIALCVSLALLQTTG